MFLLVLRQPIPSTINPQFISCLRILRAALTALATALLASYRAGNLTILLNPWRTYWNNMVLRLVRHSGKAPFDQKTEKQLGIRTTVLSLDLDIVGNDVEDSRETAWMEALRKYLVRQTPSVADFLERLPPHMCQPSHMMHSLSRDVAYWAFSVDRPYSHIRTLLQECGAFTNSGYGNRRKNIVPGLLVIDCMSRKVVLADFRCNYVALSYVWGAPRCDEAGFDMDLSRRILPQTVEDAMNVAQILGFRYLWVDRYCIDNFEPQKKHHMINNMDTIYRSATLTIIAAAGSDAEHGLPNVSKKHSGSRGGVAPPWDGMVYDQLFGPNLEQYNNSVWSTRGWTFQEGLLSRRRLVFTDSAATFQILNQDRVKRSSEIYSHIDQYSQRQLTRETDSLAAFLGVFRAYEKLQPPLMHLWGIPFNITLDGHIEWPGEGLLWTSHGCPLHRIPGLPSWTWAGWRGWSVPECKGKHIAPRTAQGAPYRWLTQNVNLRRDTVWREPSDISIEVMVGGQARHIRDYFGARLGTSEDDIVPEPVLYLTGWSTTVNAFIATAGAINLLDEDMKPATVTLDAATESAQARKPPHSSRYREWTAVIISWAGFEPWPNHRETISFEAERRWTQSLVLERVREDTFCRVGVLETDWDKSGLERDGYGGGRIGPLHRHFARRCLRII